LTEVRNPPKTLRRAAPIAISAVTVLYVLANISYVSEPGRLSILLEGLLTHTY
jgi:amino acid transporter